MRRTDTCGIRTWMPRGSRTTTATGRRCGRTVGRGLELRSGPGRRTTTAVGVIPAVRGSGSLDERGDRPGSHWASAPGYVSWCPLGFDSRPVFGLSAGVNSFRAGWVVVPRTSFGYRGAFRQSPRGLTCSSSTRHDVHRFADGARRSSRTVETHSATLLRRAASRLKGEIHLSDHFPNRRPQAERERTRRAERFRPTRPALLLNRSCAAAQSLQNLRVR